jgi:PPM family protein phosphatase
MAVDSIKVRPGVEVASLSDVGLQRENNEDSCLYWEPRDEKEFAHKGRLAVVADGMGGYDGGQEASRLAVETVREVYDKGFRDNPQSTLIEAFVSAHERIRGYAAQHPQFHGMGTTCTALAMVGRQLYFAHIGDSRLYRVRGTEISRLTRDHTYVGRLVESGIVRAEDAESHPQRHILTSALGSGVEIAADFSQQAQSLEDGDVLILCTDGLWGLVSEQDLAREVRTNAPAASCAALVQMALENGAPDNITVQVLRVGEG